MMYPYQHISIFVLVVAFVSIVRLIRHIYCSEIENNYNIVSDAVRNQFVVISFDVIFSEVLSRI
jgi:hypothetical protein